MPQGFVTGAAHIFAFVGPPVAVSTLIPPSAAAVGAAAGLGIAGSLAGLVGATVAGAASAISTALSQITTIPSPLYLGTAENTPRLEIRPEHVPYFNSIYSTKCPMDICDQGYDSMFMADLNRLDLNVAGKLFSRPNPNGVFGMQGPGELGSLIVQENLSHALAIQFPYSAKPAMAGTATGGPLPQGFLFLNARLIGPDSWEPLNMTPLKIRFVWELLPTLKPGPNNTTVCYYHTNQLPLLPTVS